MKNKLPIEIHDSIFIPASRCPQCRKLLDATTGLESRTPREGDFSICFYCGQLAIFTSDKKLRAASEAEMKDFRQNSPKEFALTEKLSRIFKAKRAGREN